MAPQISPPPSPRQAEHPGGTRALLRLDSFARGVRGAAGLIGRAFTASERAAEEVLERFLGETFGARMARVPLSLGSGGVDPFGLDPQWAKYAMAMVAILHRKYFRTEVH